MMHAGTYTWLWLQILKDRGLLADLGERSGDIALQCSETAGFLGDVDRRIQKDAAHLDDLQVNMRRLSASQGESMAAARELSLTAQRAEQIIADGHDVIGLSLGEVVALVDHVTGLEENFLGRQQGVK